MNLCGAGYCVVVRDTVVSVMRCVGNGSVLHVLLLLCCVICCVVVIVKCHVCG